MMYSIWFFIIYLLSLTQKRNINEDLMNKEHNGIHNITVIFPPQQTISTDFLAWNFDVSAMKCLLHPRAVQAQKTQWRKPKIERRNGATSQFEHCLNSNRFWWKLVRFAAENSQQKNSTVAGLLVRIVSCFLVTISIHNVERWTNYCEAVLARQQNISTVG